MKYQIEIRETLSRTVEVEASNKLDALEKVKSLYSDSKIVLDYSDFMKTEYFVKNIN